MADRITFTLDGKQVSAAPGETIWAVAKREGIKIPNLCHVDLPGYRDILWRLLALCAAALALTAAGMVTQRMCRIDGGDRDEGLTKRRD